MVLDAIIEKLKVQKTGLEKAQRYAGDFLRILFGEAIVKKGALYIYNKAVEEDPWEPFVNLMDNSEYPEFTIFSKYKELPDTKKEILIKKAKSNEQAYPDGKLLEVLQKWQGIFSTRKEAIDIDRWNFENGDEIYSFYKDGLNRINAHISAIRD